VAKGDQAETHKYIARIATGKKDANGYNVYRYFYDADEWNEYKHGIDSEERTYIARDFEKEKSKATEKYKKTMDDIESSQRPKSVKSSARKKATTDYNKTLRSIENACTKTLNELSSASTRLIKYTKQAEVEDAETKRKKATKLISKYSKNKIKV